MVVVVWLCAMFVPSHGSGRLHSHCLVRAFRRLLRPTDLGAQLGNAVGVKVRFLYVDQTIPAIAMSTSCHHIGQSHRRCRQAHIFPVCRSVIDLWQEIENKVARGPIATNVFDILLSWQWIIVLKTHCLAIGQKSFQGKLCPGKAILNLCFWAGWMATSYYQENVVAALLWWKQLSTTRSEVSRLVFGQHKGRKHRSVDFLSFTESTLDGHQGSLRLLSLWLILVLYCLRERDATSVAHRACFTCTLQYGFKVSLEFDCSFLNLFWNHRLTATSLENLVYLDPVVFHHARAKHWDACRSAFGFWAQPSQEAWFSHRSWSKRWITWCSEKWRWKLWKPISPSFCCFVLVLLPSFLQRWIASHGLCLDLRAEANNNSGLDAAGLCQASHVASLMNSFGAAVLCHGFKGLARSV